MHEVAQTALNWLPERDDVTLGTAHRARLNPQIKPSLALCHIITHVMTELW